MFILLKRLFKLIASPFKRKEHAPTDEGWKLLNNKPLARAAADAIEENKEKIFIVGGSIIVRHNGESVTISSSTK